MKSISITKSIFILFLFIAIGCNSNQPKSQESNLENETSTESTSAQYVGEYSFQDDVESGNVSISLKEGNILSFDLYISYKGNSGVISGEVEIVDGKGVFTTDEYGDCILNFVFTDNSVHISHGEGGYDCGFGMNVTVNNTFIKKSEDTSSLTTSVMDKYLITQNSVGEFKMGQEINLPYQSDIYTIEREARKQHVDGSITVDVVEYHVFENGKEVLTIHPGYDSQGRFTNKINKFIILSEKFKTKEGIGVNSKIEDFAKLFPDYTIMREFSGYAYFMQSDETGGNMTFYIDVEDFLYNKTNSDETPLTISDFKKGTRIYEIYM